MRQIADPLGLTEREAGKLQHVVGAVQRELRLEIVGWPDPGPPGACA